MAELAIFILWRCDDVDARVKMLSMDVAEVMQGVAAYHGTLRGPNPLPSLGWCPADLAYPLVHRCIRCSAILLGRGPNMTVYGEYPHTGSLVVFAV